MTTHHFGTAVNPSHYVELPAVPVVDVPGDTVQVAPRPPSGSTILVRNALTLADLTPIVTTSNGYWSYATTDVPEIYISGDNWTTTIGPLWSQESDADAHSALSTANSALATAASASTNASTALTTANTANAGVAANSAAIAALQSSGGGGGGGGGGTGGGIGSNWIAASNAPAALKTAISAAGGQVCTGTNDHTAILSKLATYKTVWLTEGTFNIADTLVMPQGSTIFGSGPATNIVGASGASGAFAPGCLISITSDHIQLRQFTLSAGGEPANTHGIWANVTNQTNFTTGADACVVLGDLVTRNIKGDGIRMEGINNRDSKLFNIHNWNSVGRGYYLNCPDGTIHQCVAGTAGSHGFEIGTSAGNWRGSNCKSWYSDGDGFRFSGVRHNWTDIEAQDNQWAGIRLTCNLSEFSSLTCDSNSYHPEAPESNVHSGLEIGRAWDGTTFTTSNAYNLVINGVQSWDKNEQSRGYNQAYGIRVRAGVRDLVLTGFGTGDATGTHHNVSGGVLFDTAGDAIQSSNIVLGLNDVVRMTPPTATATVTSYSASKQTSSQEVTVTGTALTDDPTLNLTVPGAAGASILRYSFNGLIVYRADTTNKIKAGISVSVASGSGSVGGFAQWTYTDNSGADQVDTRRLDTVNTVTGQGSSTSGGTSTSLSDVWVMRVQGTVYASSSTTTITIKLQTAEGVASSTGCKVLDGSYLKVDLLT